MTRGPKGFGPRDPCIARFPETLRAMNADQIMEPRTHSQFDGRRGGPPPDGTVVNGQSLEDRGYDRHFDRLLIRHLPKELNAQDKEDLLKEFGASKVKMCLSNKQFRYDSALACFPSPSSALLALRRLHQLRVLNRFLVVEFARKSTDDFFNVEPEQYQPKQLQQPQQPHLHQLERSTTLSSSPGAVADAAPVEPMAATTTTTTISTTKANASFPPASVDIVGRISNALFNVASFYSNVLSLMKEMQLPAPFGDHPNIAADIFLPPKSILLRHLFGTQLISASNSASKSTPATTVSRNTFNYFVDSECFPRNDLVNVSCDNIVVSAGKPTEVVSLLENVDLPTSKKAPMVETNAKAEANSDGEAETRSIAVAEADAESESESELESDDDDGNAASKQIRYHHSEIPRIPSKRVESGSDSEVQRNEKLRKRGFNRLQAFVNEQRSPKRNRLVVDRPEGVEERLATKVVSRVKKPPIHLRLPSQHSASSEQSPQRTNSLQTQSSMVQSSASLQSHVPTRFSMVKSSLPTQSVATQSSVPTQFSKATPSAPAQVLSSSPTRLTSMPTHDPSAALKQTSFGKEGDQKELTGRFDTITASPTTAAPTITTAKSSVLSTSTASADPQLPTTTSIKSASGATTTATPTMTRLDAISIRDIEKNRISDEEMKSNSVFNNYEAGQPNLKLYVKNLAKQVTEEELRSIFVSFVEETPQLNPLEIKLMTHGRMKGQAFISFLSEEHAKKALEATHGFLWRSRPMVVSFARKAS